MTIQSEIIKRVSLSGGTYIAGTTIWDVHNAGIGNKGSNLRKLIDATFAENKKITHLYAEVGAHGRSQHSPSRVLVFDVSHATNDEYERFFEVAHFNRD